MEIIHKIGDRAKAVSEKTGEKAKAMGAKTGEKAKAVGERARVVAETARVVGEKAGETARVVSGRAGGTARDVGDLAKGVAKKSAELVEVAKVKYDISKLEKEMENNFTAMGQLQYRQFRGEEGHGPEIERLLTATVGIDEHILSLQKEVERLQPKPPFCGECQAEAPGGAHYCPNCGKKLE